MVPWTIRLVHYLPRDAKLCEMQQRAHTLVQLIRTAAPNVPNQSPMPQMATELFCHSMVGCLTPAILGAHMWAEWLHHLLLGVPMVGRDQYGYRGGGGELVWAYFGKAKFGEGKFWYKILDTMEKCGTIFPKSGHTGNRTQDF